MNMQVLGARRDVSGGYKVDVTRGQNIGRVSSEWFSRPNDARFLSLGELADAVRGRAERSRTRVVETALIHVEADRSNPERLSLILPGADAPVAPTHWSFGQLAAQVGAPAAYLRNLPAALAGINLQYGLTSNRAEQIKTLETDDAVDRQIKQRPISQAAALTEVETDFPNLLRFQSPLRADGPSSIPNRAPGSGEFCFRHLHDRSPMATLAICRTLAEEDARDLLWGSCRPKLAVRVRTGERLVPTVAAVRTDQGQ